jgi:hypothetical protein
VNGRSEEVITMITTDREVVRDLQVREPPVRRQSWVWPTLLLVLAVAAVAWWALAQGGVTEIHDSWMNVPIRLPVTFTQAVAEIHDSWMNVPIL